MYWCMNAWLVACTEVCTCTAAAAGAVAHAFFSPPLMLVPHTCSRLGEVAGGSPLPCARRVGGPDAAPSCPDACHCHWPLRRVTRWGNVGPPTHTASAIRPLAGVRSDSAAVPIRDTCVILHVWHRVGGEGDCVRYADVSCACQMASCLWRLIWSQCTGGTHVAGSARSGPVLGAGSVDIAGQTPQWKGGCLECDAGCRVLLPRR